MQKTMVAAATVWAWVHSAAVSAQDCPLSVSLAPPVQRVDAAGAAAPDDPLAAVTAIRFSGNRAVASGRLRRAMQTRPARLGRPADASRYGPSRWDVEHRRLCDVLREEGFVTARVGPPEVTDAPGASGPGAARRVVLTIPVVEGSRYRMGALTLEGVTSMDVAEARALFPVEADGTYAHEDVREGLEALRRASAARGYAQWTATTVLRPDAGRGLVDVTVQVEEGVPVFVGRIVFSGHRETLTQVLRREVLLDEGDLLDTERLAGSVERIEALGYVHVRDVRLVPSARPQALDVLIEVEPRPVVRYGLAGGVSGLEGASLTGTLGTVNLLGRGERVFGSVQLGEDVTSLELAGSRPYVFGTPWTLGLHAQKERLDFEAVEGGALPAYSRDEWAARLQAQRTLGRRSVLWFGYSFSEVTLATAEPQAATPPGFGRRRESELASTFRVDGWDHWWKPRRGLRTTLWGAWSAGTVDYFKVRARSFALAPLGGGAAVGAGAESGWIGTLGSGQVLPFDETFLLGGETDLRGFDVRTVGPRDAAGALTGGTRYALVQGEVHLDLTSWLRAVAFVDAGHAWRAGGRPAFSDVLVSTGVEARFALPYFRLPVRLIYAYNAARDDFHPRTKFRVAIGPLP
jgi:outer membrane protein insertion porin family